MLELILTGQPGEISITPYGVLLLVGILLSAWIWGRLTKGKRDARLTWIYFISLFSALLGAKVSFLLAEGWFYRHDSMALLSGRSITGGLLFGYLGVEIGKKLLGYSRATGDLFALIVPLSLALGRIGCLISGCCLGIFWEKRWWTILDEAGRSRWPAPIVELLFNLVFFIGAATARKRGWHRGNLFHLYLIAYGVFRFSHEFLRDNKIVFWRLTGYHFFAVVLVGFGVVRYWQRRGNLTV